MALKLENVQAWTPERITAAAPSILACIQRCVDEFPTELTVEWLVGDVQAGRREMWIVFDEDVPDVAVLVGFTEFRHYYATGHPFIEVCGLGGARAREALPLLAEIQAWGKANGAKACHVVGREGWAKLLQDQGYTKKSVTLKLEL